MRDYSFTVNEHDAQRPWIIVSREHRMASLKDDERFFEWANARWPQDRFTVEPDPWQDLTD